MNCIACSTRVLSPGLGSIVRAGVARRFAAPPRRERLRLRRLSGHVATLLGEKAIAALAVDGRRLDAMPRRNAILATVLAPRISYDVAAERVRRSAREPAGIDTDELHTALPAPCDCPGSIARARAPRRSAAPLRARTGPLPPRNIHLLGHVLLGHVATLLGEKAIAGFTVNEDAWMRWRGAMHPRAVLSRCATGEALRAPDCRIDADELHRLLDPRRATEPGIDR